MGKQHKYEIKQMSFNPDSSRGEQCCNLHNSNCTDIEEACCRECSNWGGRPTSSTASQEEGGHPWDNEGFKILETALRMQGVKKPLTKEFYESWHQLEAWHDWELRNAVGKVQESAATVAKSKSTASQDATILRDGKLTAWLDIELEKALAPYFPKGVLEVGPFDVIPVKNQDLNKAHAAVRKIALQYARRTGGKVYVSD